MENIKIDNLEDVHLATLGVMDTYIKKLLEKIKELAAENEQLKADADERIKHYFNELEKQGNETRYWKDCYNRLLESVM